MKQFSSVLTLFLFFVSGYGYSVCQFKKDYHYVSLSAPVTSFLEQLQILNDSSLKAISQFHPTKAFGGERWDGGIHLSMKKLIALSHKTVIFYDQSQELSNTIAHLEGLNGKGSKITGIEIQTVEKSLNDIFHHIKDTVSPYLKNCQQQIAKIEGQIQQNQYLYPQLKIAKKKALFFMGKISENNYPEKIINNDLFIKELRVKGLINPYPADTAYVNWSAKILQSYSPQWLVGLSDHCDKTHTEVSLNHINFCHPRVFIPGIDQVEVVEKFLSQWEKFQASEI